MNIVAYCRVSTEKADQLNSLDSQKKFFEEYATKQGHNLLSIYADEGISGTKIKNRLQFQRLMRDAQQGFFDMVVVKDISRFARNTVDLLESTRTLKQLGIETTFLTANMSVLGQSEFVLTIFGALAQEESANTSKRVKFGKKMNAQKGRVPNLVYGYNKMKGDYFNLTINEGEAEVVRRIFDLYVNGGYGANKIAQMLNADGIRTKRDCKWTQAGVGRILANELYVGRVINGKEEVEDFLTSKREKKDESEWFVVTKPELRIIEDEVFESVRKLVAERNVAFNTNRVRQSNKYLFSTLIRCACCGYGFRRIERQYKNKYVRWVCSGRNAHGAASCPNLHKVDDVILQDAIKAYLAEILERKEDSIESIVKEFNKLHKLKQENSDYEEELAAKLKETKKRRKKCMEMYEDELISRDEFREKAKVLNAQIKKLEGELKLAQYKLNKGDRLKDVLYASFENIDRILSMDDMTNAQLKQIIEKIVVDEHGNIDVYLKILGNIALDESVPVSNNRTQRRFRAPIVRRSISCA